MHSTEYVDHEVRIQLVESYIKDMKDSFKHLENKMDSQFKWVIGTFFGTIVTIIAMFGGVIITKLLT
jgi:hypothetical protein